MPIDEPLMLPKKTILKLLSIKETQFAAMKNRAQMPLSVGTNRHAQYDLKEVIAAWVAFNLSQHKPIAAKADAPGRVFASPLARRLAAETKLRTFPVTIENNLLKISLKAI